MKSESWVTITNNRRICKIIKIKEIQIITAKKKRKLAGYFKELLNVRTKKYSDPQLKKAKYNKT